MKYLHLLPFVVTALRTSAAAVAASSPECGIVGYDKGNPSAYYFDGSGSNANFAACSALCKANSCVSFAFGNGDCLLYSASVASDVNPTKGSPYTFYDASCPAPGASTSSTSSTLGTTTSKTTTTSSTSSTKTSTTSSSTSSPTSTTTSRSTTKSSTTSTTISTTTSATTSTSLSSTTLTTSKISSTSSSTTSSSATTSASLTPPPPCPAGPWTVSNFVWFNSSHNLDCGGTDAGNILCDTGMPVQPPGYGPPDTLNFDVSESVPSYSSCTLWNARNPGSVPIYEIGTGGCGFRCEGNTTQSWVLTYFLSDSTKAQSEATINLMAEDITCPDGTMYIGYGSTTFPISCTYDTGNNATCVSTAPTFEVAMTSWEG